MNLTPLMAIFGLSGGEFILVLIVFMSMGVVSIGTLLVVLWVVMHNKKAVPSTPIPKPPVFSEPPLTQTTKPVCRQCATTLPPDAPQGLCPACLMKAGLATEAEGALQAAKHHSAAPAIEEIAKSFPHLEILELLGQGGMGMVYKARQPHLDRFVALKILSPDLSRDLAFAERFSREAKALARLNHPNIVAVYDFGQSGGFYYLLMEYVDGLNLWQMEQARKRLAPEEAFAIVPKICDALQYAHDAGIVHRDIKPANILIDTKGRVKIADFGLAKIISQNVAGLTLTQSQATMGTPQYMAPEQVEKPLSVDHRADIYSLGVVFYEMLTGELPLGRFSPPSARAQLDVRLDEVVLKSLEKEPERRYQQVSEVKACVETIAQGKGGAGETPSPVAQSIKIQPPLGKDLANAPLSAIRQRLQHPGAGLIFMGGLSCLIGFVITVFFFINIFLIHDRLVSIAGMLLILLLFIVMMSLGGILIFSGIKMRRMQAYNLAILGSCIAMIAPGLHLIGIPIGIWSLVVLLNKDVRAGFNTPQTGTPQDRKKKGLAAVLMMITAGVLCFLFLLAAISLGRFYVLRHRVMNMTQVMENTTSETQERFQDVSEATLNVLPNLEESAFSFKDDTEKNFPAVGDVLALKKEAKAAGIDMVAVTTNTFFLYDSICLDVPEDQFDNPTMPIPSEGIFSSALFTVENQPKTLLFHTLSGFRGIIQVTKSEEPGKLVLRYKLVENTETKEQPQPPEVPEIPTIPENTSQSMSESGQ